MYPNLNSTQNTFGYSFQNNQQYVGAPLVEQMVMAPPVQQEWYGWSPERNVEGYIPMAQEPLIQTQPVFTYTINYNNNYYYSNSGNTCTYNYTDCNNKSNDISISLGQVAKGAAVAGLGLLACKMLLDA